MSVTLIIVVSTQPLSVGCVRNTLRMGVWDAGFANFQQFTTPIPPIEIGQIMPGLPH